MSDSLLQQQVRVLFPVPPGRAYELATMPYAEYLNTAEWQARRKAKIIEAGGRCAVCDSPERLECHHRTYRRRGNEDRTDLTVLCRRCHSLFHEKPVDLSAAA